jgi:excisionase family DNA binding protein
MPVKEFLSINELSEYLGIKPKTLYSWVSKGVLPHYRIEGLIRFKKQEIDQKMNSCKVEEDILIDRRIKEFEDEFSL